MIIHQCEKCGDAAGINGEHWCRTPTAAKLQRDLAAANQQLDALRAEQKYTCSKDEHAKVRAAFWSVNGEPTNAACPACLVAERDAMRAERDEAKRSNDILEKCREGDKRTHRRRWEIIVSLVEALRWEARQGDGIAEQNMPAYQAALEELRWPFDPVTDKVAALRQSTEADAKPVAYACHCDDYALAGHEPGCPIVLRPVGSSPAPVAPVAGTSEAVPAAWLVESPAGAASATVHEPNRSLHTGCKFTPLYRAAPPAPARTLVREWWEAHGERYETKEAVRSVCVAHYKRVRRYKVSLGTRGRK